MQLLIRNLCGGLKPNLMLLVNPRRRHQKVLVPMLPRRRLHNQTSPLSIPQQRSLASKDSSPIDRRSRISLTRIFSRVSRESPDCYRRASIASTDSVVFLPSNAIVNFGASSPCRQQCCSGAAGERSRTKTRPNRCKD